MWMASTVAEEKSYGLHAAIAHLTPRGVSHIKPEGNKLIILFVLGTDFGIVDTMTKLRLVWGSVGSVSRIHLATV